MTNRLMRDGHLAPGVAELVLMDIDSVIGQPPIAIVEGVFASDIAKRLA